MAKRPGLSGFPEWLPEERLVELGFLQRLAATFEAHGFAPLETRAVEPLETLLKKGATDKEIYVLRRLQAGERESDKNLGLHYDLTVPFARYVAERRGSLVFPLRRYQIQKSWRGERPQDGRFREFYQADVDVVAQGTLPLAFDADMPLLLHEALSALPMPAVTICVSNRKILEGFYRALGIEAIHPVLRMVDKLDKIGPDKVMAGLVDEVGLAAGQARRCLELAAIRGTGPEVDEAVRALGVEHPLLEEGLRELAAVMEMAVHVPPGRLVADLRIARGLDYYTGTVYEGFMEGHENLGAVCSGGRYDDLIGGGRGQTFPGVGASIGLTRILSRLLKEGWVRASRKTPSCVLIALVEEGRRDREVAVARALRRRGIACEIYHRAHRYGKQIRHAERLGIPFVWFVDEEGGGHRVRDIRSGEQAPADPHRWAPPPADLRVQLVAEAPSGGA